MTYINKKILMITPFHKSLRGNSLTSSRLQTFLSARGYDIDCISLEQVDWPEHFTRAMEESTYDLVHGFHAVYFSRALQVVPAARKLPLLLTTTGTDINYDLYIGARDEVLNAFQAAQKIVVFNEQFKIDIEKGFPLYKNKLVTIPQGVFLEPSHPLSRTDIGLSSDDFIFMLPSGLRPVKNIELAIEALSAVYEEFKQLRLLVIGAAIEPEYSRRIMEQISSLEWVVFLGEVPHEKMRAVLSLGDVVINSSLSEGQPQAALEAMSLGKPCILTTVPGNQNIIFHGVEGFYVSDNVQMARAAALFINNPMMKKAMGQNARRMVENRFNLDQEMDAYCSIYIQLTG